MLQYDQKRLYPHLYKPKKTPSLVTVPSFGYLMLRGEGDSNDALYETAASVLFSLSHAIKMAVSPKEYALAPLECLWDTAEVENKSPWVWVAMISQPDWVASQMVEQVREQVAFKQGRIAKEVFFMKQTDGLCVTMLHTGSYEHISQSFFQMEDFAAQQNLTRINSSHREIYLSNPRKTDQAKLETVLRFSVS